MKIVKIVQNREKIIKSFVRFPSVTMILIVLLFTPFVPLSLPGLEFCYLK